MYASGQSDLTLTFSGSTGLTGAADATLRRTAASFGHATLVDAEHSNKDGSCRPFFERPPRMLVRIQYGIC